LSDEQEVRATVRSIVLRLAPEPGGDPQGNLIEELAYHSLALLELAFAVEEAFGLRPMDMQTARSIQSSADLEAYVLRELATK
jgi:acyl carrier protein